MLYNINQVLYLLELFYYVLKIQLLIYSFIYKYKVNENINVTCFI